MRYLPHSEEDIKEMLQAIGVEDIDDLFGMIPQHCRMTKPLNLPDPMTEWELQRHLTERASDAGISPDYKVFVGAGSYEHFIPAWIPYVLERSEFTTAYTPYQPEVSQGTLQGIYEYQTLICRLLGMEVANASLYDGASALAEGLLMAIRISKKKKVAVSHTVHPHYRQVVRTYLKPTGYEIIELPYDDDGRTDLTSVQGIGDLAAVAVQSPNFFGCVENLAEVHDQADAAGAMLVVTFTEALSYGLLRNPGSFGADIVCGEGQSLGIPQSFGGPSLGILATQMKYVRSMPGRLVGKTVDRDGRRGFVLTLATREQHIRREKATSNICTNQGLCALAAAMYMACLGKTGFQELATLNYDKAEYGKKRLQDAGYRIPFQSPTFNEFLVDCSSAPAGWYDEVVNDKIIPGMCVDTDYPALKHHYLLCVTETKTKDDIDVLVERMAS